ncbi:MAG: hypothetical protein AAF138_09535 [Planctomycetota bacterium]
MTHARSAQNADSPPSIGAAIWALAGVVLLALMAVLGSIGGPQGPIGALIAVVAALLLDGAWAAAYLVAAFGWGGLTLAAIDRAGGGRARWDRLALEAAVGIGVLMTLSHALGWAGAFPSNALGKGIAIGVLAVGILWRALSTARLLRRDGGVRRRPSRGWLLALPATAVLLVAASNPPGWLWDSEAGGYDALSYHLQLPQEWIALGRLQPLEHNVYSYLPGYVEAAMYHVGIAAGARGPIEGAPLWGLLSDGGRALVTMQLLHAGMALMAAWLIARLATSAARLTGASTPHATRVGVIAGALALATPWVVVTGSLAYNEMAMVLLGAGAMLAAIERGFKPWARGALVGGLVGLACGAKPTAIFFFTPVCALLLVGPPLLLARRVTRPMVVTALVGMLAGVLMLAPWLVRNAAHGGNPVFPAMTELFGTAHWDAEQADRWAGAHSFNGTTSERLELIVRPDGADPAGIRHRGMLHPQWGALWIIALAAAMITLARRPTRFIGALAALGLLAQVIAWLLLTHVQSRFLLPAVAPICVLVALASPPLRLGRVRPEWLVAVLVAVQTVFMIAIFTEQRQSSGGSLGPNAWLLGGPGVFTGEALRPEDRWQRAEAWLNFGDLHAEADGRTLVLGDAAVLYHASPIDWATTWDRSLLGALMREHPDDPAAWRRALRDRGVSLVFVRWSELQRLSDTGWHDPLVTPERVARFLAQEAEPMPRVRSSLPTSTPTWELFRLRGDP